MEPLDYLSALLTELFPDGDGELYNPGSEPGQISQELYNELMDSYAAAQALLNTDDSMFL